MRWVTIEKSRGGHTEAMEAGGGVLMRYCRWGGNYDEIDSRVTGSMTFIPNSHIVGEEQPKIVSNTVGRRGLL